MSMSKGKVSQVIGPVVDVRYDNGAELPTIFEDLTNDSEDAKRNIRRYRSRGKSILLNVANGRFPGKY